MKPKGKNSFGLDAAYFHGKLSLIVRDISHYTPDEMYRTLTRLADVVKPAQEPVSIKTADEEIKERFSKMNLTDMSFGDAAQIVRECHERYSSELRAALEARQSVAETCPQCGVRSGNGHCLGDIFNCSDMTSRSKTSSNGVTHE